MGKFARLTVYATVIATSGSSPFPYWLMHLRRYREVQSD